MTLAFTARVDGRSFDVSLSVAAGETVAILGPNGAGKSTLLDLVAGLLKPDSGRAELDGTVLFDIATGAPSRWTPPHRRGISLLAQDPLLFPHLSVLDNVAFGPASAGATRHNARTRAQSWLTEVDALDLAMRRPTELSGGQSQRIAVARALAAEPRLLLLDEPLAALDVSVAPVLRRMLRRVLERRSAIIVTHDILDAFTLADRVVVLSTGAIVEEGPTREVLERPRSPFTAGLAALNVLIGTRTADGLRTKQGATIRTGGSADIAPGATVAASIRPSAVGVTVSPPPGGATNVIAGVVQDLEPRGDIIRVRSEFFSADIAPRLVADLDLVPGTRVWFAFAPADAEIYRL